MDVPRGKYTDMFLPRYEMSPGSLPSGRPVRPNSRRRPPATSRSNPKPMSTRPKSFMALFYGEGRSGAGLEKSRAKAHSLRRRCFSAGLKSSSPLLKQGAPTKLLSAGVSFRLRFQYVNCAARDADLLYLVHDLGEKIHSAVQSSLRAVVRRNSPKSGQTEASCTRVR